jgi:hypothetical protein
MNIYLCSVMTKVALLSLLAWAFVQASPQTKAITNQDILKMAKARLSEDVIIRTIEAAESTAFDVSPQALIALKKSRIPDRVVKAMITAQANSKTKTGPRLQETLEWLDNNFNYGNDSGPAQQLISPPDEKRFFYSVGNFKSCVCRWSNRESRIKNNVTRVVSSEELTVDLAAIDPNKVLVEDVKDYWRVRINTTNDTQKIKSHLWIARDVSPDGNEVSQDTVTNSAFFVVSGQQRGQKMAEAFKTVIMLCGGKKSASF